MGGARIRIQYTETNDGDKWLIRKFDKGAEPEQPQSPPTKRARAESPELLPRLHPNRKKLFGDDGNADERVIWCPPAPPALPAPPAGHEWHMQTRFIAVKKEEDEFSA